MSDSSPTDGDFAAKWHKDAYGSYYERYVDNDGFWTGWVTDRFWDPRWPDPPDPRLDLIEEGWALLWYADRIVIIGETGARVNVPAGSVVSCDPVADAEKRAALKLVVEFGGPPSAAPRGTAFVVVHLMGPVGLLPKFDEFQSRLQEYRRRRARGLGLRSGSTLDRSVPYDESDGEHPDWQDDPYGVFTQRLRDRESCWTGWVVDQLWDPWFRAPDSDIDIALRNTAGAVQWYSGRIAMVGKSGGHLLAPSSACMATAPLRKGKRSRRGDSPPTLQLQVSLTTAGEPWSAATINIACPKGAQGAAANLLDLLSNASTANVASPVDAATAYVKDGRSGVPADDDIPPERRDTAGSPLLASPVVPSALVETLSVLIESRSDGVMGGESDLSGSDAKLSTQDTWAEAAETAAPTEPGPPALIRIAFDTVPSEAAWTSFAPLDSADEICLLRDVDRIGKEGQGIVQ